MKKYLILVFIPLIISTGCNKGTESQREEYARKAFTRGFEDKTPLAENVENYEKPDAVPIEDMNENSLNFTLRKTLQPGRLWKGYTDLGEIQLPIGVKFTNDGHFDFYSQDPTGAWTSQHNQVPLEKILYKVFKDQEELHADSSDEVKEATSVERVISWQKALDTPYIAGPLAKLHWLPCYAGTCEISIGLLANEDEVDGFSMTVGPLTHHFK